MPKASVITPLFNGERHVLETIASVQNQTFTDYEHIIIDNGSSDRGLVLVKEAASKDDRIVILSNDDTPGAGPTRNMGIERAKGDIITFLDADDQWLPNKLAHQIEFMEKHNLGFCWTSYETQDTEGNKLQVIKADRSATYADWLYKRTSIGCLTAAYDVRLLGKNYMNHLPMRQDFCLWLDLMKKSDQDGIAYGGLQEILARYRVHSDGMTSNKFKAAKMQWRAYREHVGLSPLATVSVFASYATLSILRRTLLKNT